MVGKAPSPDTAHNGIPTTAKVGTIVLFILLAMVASVAAGVLINTVGFLGPTGGDLPATQTPATSPLDVVETTGHVTADGPPAVETVVLTVQVGGSHDTLDVANVTLDWFGPNGQTTLTYGADPATATGGQPAPAFAVGTDYDADGSRPRLNSPDDRLTVILDAAEITGQRGLAPGTTVALKFTTATGATHYLTLDVPARLDQQRTVTL